MFWKVHCKKNLSPIRDSPDPTPFSDWWEHIFFSLVLASFLLGGLLWRLQTNVSLVQVSSPHRLRPSQRNKTLEATLGRGIEPRVWGWRGDLVSLLFYGCWSYIWCLTTDIILQLWKLEVLSGSRGDNQGSSKMDTLRSSGKNKFLLLSQFPETFCNPRLAAHLIFKTSLSHSVL